MGPGKISLAALSEVLKNAGPGTERLNEGVHWHLVAKSWWHNFLKHPPTLEVKLECIVLTPRTSDRCRGAIGQSRPASKLEAFREADVGQAVPVRAGGGAEWWRMGRKFERAGC